jgi:hypothetical protein
LLIPATIFHEAVDDAEAHDGGVVQSRCRWRDAGAAPVELPAASAHPRLVRVSVGGAKANFGHSATNPHLVLRDRGWAPPIRARVKARLVRLVRWAQTVEINTNTSDRSKKKTNHTSTVNPNWNKNRK